jgi:GNAT superfamily N-acetyltransferase
MSQVSPFASPQTPSASGHRKKLGLALYWIREVDGQDEELADILTELHRLTFFDGAPVPSFESGHWWLAYHQAMPVAFAGAVASTHIRNAGYICRVGVLPAHCGRGLQLRLLRAAESRARRNGWDSVVSDTTRNLASANNFIRAGYRLYQPDNPWAFADTLYWRKDIRTRASPHGTHSKRL